MKGERLTRREPRRNWAACTILISEMRNQGWESYRDVAKTTEPVSSGTGIWAPACLIPQKHGGHSANYSSIDGNQAEGHDLDTYTSGTEQSSQLHCRILIPPVAPAVAQLQAAPS